jgi:DNA-binding MarR family transcriptional regulator
MTQQIIDLTTTEALVLQQVHEDGEDDLPSLSRQLGISRRYALAIVASLKRKGLLVVTDSYHQLWVRPSARGKRMIRYIWPQARTYVTAL